MSAKSEVSNWEFSTFLENNNNKFNKNVENSQFKTSDLADMC